MCFNMVLQALVYNIGMLFTCVLACYVILQLMLTYYFNIYSRTFNCGCFLVSKHFFT